MIYGISGPAGSGKDTAANLLVQRYGYQKGKFARALKQGLAAMGFPEPAEEFKDKIMPGWKFTWRQLAQTLGTEWGRNMIDPDLWVKIEEASWYNSNVDIQYLNIVYADVRFENEARVIREAGGQIIHLVGRKRDMHNAAQANHVSEQGIEVVPGDLTIANSGSMEEYLYKLKYAFIGLPYVDSTS